MFLLSVIISGLRQIVLSVLIWAIRSTGYYLAYQKENKKKKQEKERKKKAIVLALIFFPNGLCAHRIQILMSNYLVKFHIA